VALVLAVGGLAVVLSELTGPVAAWGAVAGIGGVYLFVALVRAQRRGGG